jgi:hypothetical protein
VPEPAQWLEVAQFQTENRARQFREDFMSLVRTDELGIITGPALAAVIADDLEMDSQWQTMDGLALEKLKAGEWSVGCQSDQWKPIEHDRLPHPAVFDVEL